MKALKYPTTDSPRITIRHLLSHSKGFPKTTPGATASSPTPTSSSRRCCSGGIPFSNAPGVAYEYSNYGFAILGRIVSNVSGVKYADYVDAPTSFGRSG